MNAERINRIVDAVEDIERNIGRLRELQTVSLAEYTSNGNQDLRDSVERKFEKLTEAVLDIAGQILKEEGKSVPARRKQRITELETECVIKPSLAKRLRDSVGFRDVLSHTYGSIVNDQLVYEAMQNSLNRYVEFLAAVDLYLSNVSEE